MDGTAWESREFTFSTLGKELTNRVERIESSRKYRRPTAVTMSTLATPMVIPRGNKALCKSLLPEGGTGGRKGLNKGSL